MLYGAICACADLRGSAVWYGMSASAPCYANKPETSVMLQRTCPTVYILLVQLDSPGL